MKAEEFKTALEKLKDTTIWVRGLLVAHGCKAPLAKLDEAWREVDRHCLEMEAAETQPAKSADTLRCNKCHDHVDVKLPMICLPCYRQIVAEVVGQDYTRQLDREYHDTINKRIDKLFADLTPTIHGTFACNIVGRLDVIEKRLGEIDGRLNSQTHSIEALRKRIAGLYKAYDRLHVRLEEIEAAASPAPPITERNAAAIALLNKWMAEDGGYDEDAWARINARLNPPPTEVEMRVVSATHGYKWEWCFGTEPWMAVVKDQRIYSATPALAKAHGVAWLAALSKKLGVTLVPKWEKDE